MDPDFDQLSHDVDLISRIKHFREATNKIVDILKPLDNQEFYEKLNNDDKIKYNLFMSFSMNTLFWMYLRSEGVDPSSHRIKTENERLKQSMARSQRIKDRKTIMPRLNKNVASRFIRSGLWTPGTGPSQKVLSNQEQEENWDEPPKEVNQEKTENSSQITESNEVSTSKNEDSSQIIDSNRVEDSSQVEEPSVAKD